MVFHWNLSDSKSPQVSRTLLSILAVLNNAIVWVVPTRPLAYKSCSPFNGPLVTVPNVPITIGIIVILMFHCFFLISYQGLGINPSASSSSSSSSSYYYYYYYYYYYSLIRAFHISVSRWFFTGV